MATITSPRLPNRPASPASSVRSSLSIDRASASASTQPVAPAIRRNRSALRDFYNLPAAAPPQTPSAASVAASGTSTPAPAPSDVADDEDDDPAADAADAELDRADFAPDAHVEALLRSAGLGDVLRTEARLLGEIRGLDGEKKALVYDNYSKLIHATDTIGRMRGDMDKEGVGLEGVGARLEGLVGGIVARAEAVAQPGTHAGAARSAQSGQNTQADGAPDVGRDAVRYALQNPQRLRGLLDAGERAAADQDWQETRSLLDKWKDVGGVAELRGRCEEVMATEQQAPDADE